MKQILKLVFLLVIGQTAFAQAPSNYTNINGRYRWIAGMFDSTFHIPKGSTPSLRTGGSTNSGGLFYNTSDSSVYTYTGTQWIKLRGSINPSDTTNKYVTQVYKKSGSDSIFYVKGGIHTWAFNDSTGSPGGGGGGKVYYFNGGVSMGTFGGFQMYELGDTANTGAAANFTRSTTGNIANFITDPGKPGLLQIPAGVWSVDAWLSETGGGANHAEIWVEVEKWDGSTITTIATSPIEQITEGATPNLYSWSVSIPTTSLTVTDRIIIQFYISNTNGKTVTLYTQNGYVGEVHTTFTTGIGAINGLTAPAQYLVTGTSGTDFNINSSTATHTFNLPTASATNRGALSTTDWSTFNNKIGGSLVSGYLTKATGTNTIDTSQIYQTNGKIGIGKTNPTAKVDITDSLGTALRVTNIGPYGVGGDGINVRVNGWSGYAALIEQRDSSAAGTQYQTVFRKGMLPGYGNPAPGGGVAFITQIGGENEVYKNLTVYRARMIDSTGYSVGQVMGTSQEIWTRKNGVWDTTLVLNQGNVGVNTGQNGIDSVLTVANGTWLKRGVRMSALPTGVGTKALRIDANGTLSVADTLTNGVSGSLTANFIPKATGTTTLNNSPLSVGSGVVGLGLGVVPPNSWSNYWALQLANGVSLASYNYADIPIGWLGTNAYHDGIGDIRVSNGAANKYLQDKGNHKWYVAGYGASGSYISFTQAMTLDTLNRLGVGTTTLDSMFKVAQGVHLERGVRMSGLPTGVGTKSLRVDANGTVSLADTLANGISGTGTTTYLSKFTGSTSIGNSMITEGAANEVALEGNGTTGGSLNLKHYASFSGKGVGYSWIGVSSNNYWFQSQTASGTKSFYFDITNNTLNSVRQYIMPNASGTLALTSDITSAISGTTNYIPKFTSSSAIGNSNFITDASGNLGLGVSPSSWSNGGNLQLPNDRRISFSGVYGEVVTNAYYNAGWKYYGTGAAADYSQDAGKHIWYNAASGSADAAVSWTTRMTLDASGNLGLGVTPSAWSAGWKAINVGAYGQIASDFVNDGSFNIANGAYASGPLTWKYAVNGTVSRYQQDNGSHKWFNAGAGSLNNTVSFTQAMTLDASGNLLVGNTSTALGEKLNVTGFGIAVERTDGGSTLLLGHFGGNDGVIGMYTNNNLTFRTNNTERMRLDASGNLGLGVTPSAWSAAARAFQVQSTTVAFAGVTGFPVMGNNWIYNSSNLDVYVSNGFASRYYQQTGTHVWQIAASGTAGNAISWTSAMTLDASGNLLVATTSPSYNAAGRGNITIGGSSSSILGLQVGGVAKGYVYHDNINYGLWNTANGYMAFGTNDTERMRITSGGNVGIGNTNPNSYYSGANNLVVGNTTASNGMTIASINSGFGAFYFADGTTGSELYRGFIEYGHTNDYMAFGSAGSERMRLTSSGELLINTTSDAGDYKLQVNGTALMIARSSSTEGLFVYGGSSIGTPTTSSGQILFGQTSAYRGSLAYDDNVGYLYLDNTYNSDNARIYFRTKTNGTAINALTLLGNGNAEFGGSIKTAAPSGGTAKPFKIGAAAVVSPTSPNRTIEIEIDGVTYYLSAKTTND